MPPKWPTKQEPIWGVAKLPKVRRAEKAPVLCTDSSLEPQPLEELTLPLQVERLLQISSPIPEGVEVSCTPAKRLSNLRKIAFTAAVAPLDRAFLAERADGELVAMSNRVCLK